jgi:hypothetical protein
MLSCKNPIVYKVNECEPKQCSSLHISYCMSGTGTAEELQIKLRMHQTIEEKGLAG